MSKRPPEKRCEDVFFVLMVTAILVLNFIGFARTYYMAGLFRSPLPSFLVHLHGALFSSWLLLLMVQTILVSLGKLRWHRRLGIVGALIAAMMLVVASLTLAAAFTVTLSATEAGAAFLTVADAGGIAIFAIFVAASLFKRNNLILHNSRWSFRFMDWPPAIFLLWLAFPLIALLYETLSRRRPYRVSVLCSLVIVVLSIECRATVHDATCKANRSFYGLRAQQVAFEKVLRRSPSWPLSCCEAVNPRKAVPPKHSEKSSR